MDNDAYFNNWFFNFNQYWNISVFSLYKKLNQRIKGTLHFYSSGSIFLNQSGSEQLRQYLNRELYLGLFDFECHYAHYPQGAFYKKHYDAFQGSSNRRLSTVLYLNPNWLPEDGGELILYTNDGDTVLETVLPKFGNMVIFLSEEFPHEVLPTNRSRYSLTGWFRINNIPKLKGRRDLIMTNAAKWLENNPSVTFTKMETGVIKL